MSESHVGDLPVSSMLPEPPEKAITGSDHHGFRKQGSQTAKERAQQLKKKFDSLQQEQDELAPERAILSSKAHEELKDAEQLRTRANEAIEKVTENDLKEFGVRTHNELQETIDFLQDNLKQFENAASLQTDTGQAGLVSMQSLPVKERAAQLKKENLQDERTKTKREIEKIKTDMDLVWRLFAERGKSNTSANEEVTGLNMQVLNEDSPFERGSDAKQKSTHNTANGGQAEQVAGIEQILDEGTEQGEQTSDQKNHGTHDDRQQEDERQHREGLDPYYSLRLATQGQKLKKLNKKLKRLDKRLSNLEKNLKTKEDFDVEEDLEKEETKVRVENDTELEAYNRLDSKKKALEPLHRQKAMLDLKYSSHSTGTGKGHSFLETWLIRRFRQNTSASARSRILDLVLSLNDDMTDSERENQSDSSDVDSDEDEHDDTGDEPVKAMCREFLELQGDVIIKIQALEAQINKVLEFLLRYNRLLHLGLILKKEMSLEGHWMEYLRNPRESNTGEGHNSTPGRHGHLFSNHPVRKEIYREAPINEGQFRVLILAPAPEAYYPLICKMEAWPASAAQGDLATATVESEEYAALSYFWDSDIFNGRLYFLGPSRDMSSIKEDEWGSSARSATQVRIRNNLFRALLSLRRCGKDAKPVAIWVDFLCINQEDLGEKTKQLSKMVDIYSRASRVCIWLGDSNDRSDEAMDFIPTIVDFAVFDSNARDKRQATKWYSLSELMRDRWFSRRWVVQEIALAKDASVHCGSKKVRWCDFADAITLLVTNQETIRSLFEDPSRWRDGRKTLGDVDSFGASVLLEVTNGLFRRTPEGNIKKPVKTIEYLVTSLKTFDTANTSDLIYSLVSIASDTSPIEYWHGAPATGVGKISIKPANGIQADYNKSPMDVYKDFTKFCMESSKSLDIICRPWAMPLGEPVPSWIPLLENSEFGIPEKVYSGRKNGCCLVGLAGSSTYQASGDLERLKVRFEQRANDQPQGSHRPKSKGLRDAISKQNTTSSPEGKPKHVLVVEGMTLANITAISPRNTGGIIHRESLRMGGWNGFKRDINGVEDRIWRTLVADRDQDGHAPPSWYQRACLRCLEMADMFNNGDLNVGELLMGHSEMLRKYLMRVRNVTWNRRFFSTKPQEPAPATDISGGKVRDLQDSTSPTSTIIEGKEGDGDEAQKMRQESVQETQQTIGKGNIVQQAPQPEEQTLLISDGLNKDLFGLCPPHTKAGDSICILFGCSVPVILRPRKDGFVELVGEAYVHGKMEGEAVEDFGPGTLPKKEFCIV